MIMEFKLSLLFLAFFSVAMVECYPQDTFRKRHEDVLLKLKSLINDYTEKKGNEPPKEEVSLDVRDEGSGSGFGTRDFNNELEDEGFILDAKQLLLHRLLNDLKKRRSEGE